MRSVSTPARRRLRVGLSLVLLPGLAVVGAGCASIDLQNADQVGRTLAPGVAFTLLRDTPRTPILDLRSEGEFHGRTGHLVRARNLPADRIEASSRWLAEFGDSTVLTYCASTCSADVVEALTAAGLEMALVIEGGIDAWLASGFGTVHEDCGDIADEERGGPG